MRVPAGHRREEPALVALVLTEVKRWLVVPEGFYDDLELFAAWAKRAHALVPAKLAKTKKKPPKSAAREEAFSSRAWRRCSSSECPLARIPGRSALSSAKSRELICVGYAYGAYDRHVGR